jgi:hypothetical protein
MKLELKTENEKYSNLFSQFIKNVIFLSLIIIVCDVSLKLGNISKHYQINHNCKLISVEKSSSNFKKLSKLSNLKSKQRIWEFCREFVK